VTHLSDGKEHVGCDMVSKWVASPSLGSRQLSTVLIRHSVSWP